GRGWGSLPAPRPPWRRAPSWSSAWTTTRRRRRSLTRRRSFRPLPGGESEFVTISDWESVEAMSRFAGADPRRIHHLERDAGFLIELPSGVQVLDLVVSSGRTGGGPS